MLKSLSNNKTPNSLKGFTLLEALVAMLLIATVGMTCFDWINTNLKSLARVQDHSVRAQVIRNALAFMETVNPMKNPKGEAELGTCRIRWEAHLTEPEKNGSGQSLYRLGLYNTHITIERNQEEITSFELRQVGYKQTRKAGIGF